MTMEAQSAVAYRPLIRATYTAPGSGNDIKDINTHPLPNGAECYVLENRSAYRLAKNSTLTPSGATIIAPGSGPGRWLLVVAGAGASAGAFVYSTVGLNNTFGLTGEWVGPDTANFAADAAAGIWSLTAIGCSLAYFGPTISVIARLTASMSVAAGESAQSVYAGVSHAEDLSGTLAGSNGGPRGGNFYVQRADNEDVLIVSSERRIPALVSGEVLQPRFGSGTSVLTGTVYSMQLMVVPG